MSNLTIHDTVRLIRTVYGYKVQISYAISNNMLILFLLFIISCTCAQKPYVYFRSGWPEKGRHYAKSPLREISIDLRIVKPYTTGRARAQIKKKKVSMGFYVVLRVLARSAMHDP